MSSSKFWREQASTRASVRVKLRKPKPVSPPITKYFERKPLAALNRVISKFEGPQKLMKSVCTPGNSALASQAEHKAALPIQEDWVVLCTPTKPDSLTCSTTAVENNWVLVSSNTVPEEKRSSLQESAMPKTSASLGQESALSPMLISPPHPVSQHVILIGDTPPPLDPSTDLTVPTPKRVCIDLTESPMFVPLLPTKPSLKSTLARSPPEHPAVRHELTLSPEGDTAESGRGGRKRRLTSLGESVTSDVDSDEGNICLSKQQQTKLRLLTGEEVVFTIPLPSPTVLCERVQTLHLATPVSLSKVASPLTAKSPSPLPSSDAQDQHTLEEEVERVQILQLASPVPLPEVASPPTVKAPSPPPSSGAQDQLTLSSLEKEMDVVEDDMVLPVPKGPALSVEDKVEILLWERGVPYLKETSPTVKVQLLTTTQNTVAENIMDNGPFSLSLRLLSIVDYLSISTSSNRLPRAALIHRLWGMILDPHVVSNHISPDSLLKCINYFRSLLLCHPPGQHRTVDAVYSGFVSLLGPRVGGFTAWEEIATLISSHGHCTHLFVFLVDLFLSDYWAWLSRPPSSRRQPLFVAVFWQNSNSFHVTMPVRRLVDLTVNLLGKPNPTEIERTQLDGVMCLLGLVLSRCHDLATEVTVALGERASTIPLH